MTSIALTAPARLRGVVDLPGDKSISHRAVIFNALAQGSAQITNFLPGADCLSTVACMRALGVSVMVDGTTVQIEGVGLRGLSEPVDVLDCGNSGTTLRLLAGLLAGQPLFVVLTGDASLRSRPQRRVVEPLRALGSQLDGRLGGDRAPLAVRGTILRGGDYTLPIASAQVKSALLLAALGGAGPLHLAGRIDSRDHTERMLAAMGAEIHVRPDQISLLPPQPPTDQLLPLSLRVPGDPSSAAFWWVAAAIHPDAEITTTDVCLNPTRIGALEVLRAMGAQIYITNEHQAGSEPVGDVTVRSSLLRGTTIGGAIIPRLIDEIPVLAVAAACAEGATHIRDAQELRAKETDRIATVAAGLAALGIVVEPQPDGMTIRGGAGAPLQAATLPSHADHRLAMAWAVAAMAGRDTTTIVGADAVAVSYPDFWETLQRLSYT
jgi:3-phosphoshikimate 1-carboxyvinyltransferase